MSRKSLVPTERGIRAYLEFWPPIFREVYRVLLRKGRSLSVDDVAAELGIDRYAVLETLRDGRTSGFLRTRRQYRGNTVRTFWGVDPRVRENLRRVLEDFPELLICNRCRGTVEKKRGEWEGWKKILLRDGTSETLCPRCLSELKPSL
ncbi:MAG: hypothetical protein QXR87_06955 [Candidatus Hadarchaeales archaeon]